MSDWSTVRLNLRYRWKAILLWGIGIVGALVFALWTMTERAEAWVQGYQPFPEGRATVLLHRFCRASNCDYSDITGRDWTVAIQNAARAWNAAGSNFSFFERAARTNDDPCRPQAGNVYVILAEPGTLCPGDGPLRAAGRTEYGSGWARVYIKANSESSKDPRELQRLLLHEFGHVVGLGHPDEHGQYERAIMNSHLGFGIGSNWAPFDELQPDDIAGIRALYPITETIPPSDTIIGFLENPGDDSSQSGVGIISGWVCDAEKLEISFDGGPRLFVPYGSERTDTAYTQDGTAICGDTDNGFGLLINYNELGDGPHTVTLYVDGVVHTQTSFNVVTLGTNFLRGVTGQGTIALSDGKQVTVQWDEALQGFTIIDFVEGDEEDEDNTSRPISHLSFDAFWGNWEFTSPIGTFEWRVFQVNEDSVYAHVDSPGFSEPTGFLIIGSAANSDYPAVLTAGYDYVASWRPGSYCYLYAFSFTDEEMTEGEVWRWRQSDSNVCGPAPTSGQSYAARTYRK